MAAIPPLLIFTFAVLHILGAVGWLAFNLISDLGLDKRLAQLSEGSLKEYNEKVNPNLGLQYRIFSGMTIVFGALFAYSFAGGDLSFYSPTNPIGSRILVGGILGLFAYLVGNTRWLRKLSIYFRKLRVGSLETYVLMATFLFMVAAAHPYV